MDVLHSHMLPVVPSCLKFIKLTVMTASKQFNNTFAYILYCMGIIWFQEFLSRTVYGSHYDEARITRQNTIDPLDGEIAKRTYEGHQELQKITGK